jgi:hypothetical protein
MLYPFSPKSRQRSIAITQSTNVANRIKPNYFTSSVGTKDYDSEQIILLYPNPAVSFTYINIHGIKGNTNIRITDVSGKIFLNDVYNINEIQYTFKTRYIKYPKGFFISTIIITIKQ